MLSEATIDVLELLGRSKKRERLLACPPLVLLTLLTPALIAAHLSSGFSAPLIGLVVLFVQKMTYSVLMKYKLISKNTLQTVLNFNEYMWLADPIFRSTCSFAMFDSLMKAIPNDFLLRIRHLQEADQFNEFLESINTKHQALLVKLGADIVDFPKLNEDLLPAKFDLDKLSLQWLAIKTAIKNNLEVNEENTNLYTLPIYRVAKEFYEQGPVYLENKQVASQNYHP